MEIRTEQMIKFPYPSLSRPLLVLRLVLGIILKNYCTPQEDAQGGWGLEAVSYEEETEENRRSFGQDTAVSKT